MSSLFIAPHNDDESLFGAFTLIREKPLVVVVTDSWIQPNRGEWGCSPDERWQETLDAMKILGCPVYRMGLRDDMLFQELLSDGLARFQGFDKVYCPAIQGGNTQHDLISIVCQSIFTDNLLQYTTYTKTELYTKGNREIIPTLEELELKHKALECYTSQLRINGPHFEAVRGKSEWII